MLVEGVDDSVSIPFSLIVVVFIFLMLTYLRENLFTINQFNPELHNDSFDEINNLRNRLFNSDGSSDRASDNTNIETNSSRNSQITCPICLTNAVLPVETNCKHCFCGACITQYWRHSTNDILHSKMNCPMCRTQVAYLLPLFSMAIERRRSNSNNQLFDLINAYNRIFSGLPRSLWDQLQEIPLLLRHLINELLTFNNMEIWFRLRFGFMFLIALMYFLSPLDIIPEALFGLLGYMDDFLVLIMMALYICSIYRQIIFQRAS